MNKIEEVYSIFQDSFGEELVDLQGDYILVLFPRTTIINENERSTEIGKLFAKIKLAVDGTLVGTFQLLRTEFSELHFRSGYIHSHVPAFSASFDSINEFKNPCLGSGPIRATCAILNCNFDEDRWRLFCYELSKYVTVESLSGGPYFRMEDIGCRDIFSSGSEPWIEIEYAYTMFGSDPCYKDVSTKFISYILSKNVLPLSYGNNFYSIALSPYDLTVTLSNLFIEWYNSLPNYKKPGVGTYIRDNSLWFEGKCLNGKVYKRNQYYRGEHSKDLKDYIGRTMLTFKGIEQKLEIPDYVAENNVEQQEETSILLTDSFAKDVVNRLIKIINYGLIKNTTNRSKNSTHFTCIGEDTEIIF